MGFFGRAIGNSFSFPGKHFLPTSDTVLIRGKINSFHCRLSPKNARSKTMPQSAYYRRLAAGLCPACGGPPDKIRRLCAACRAIRAKQVNAQRAKKVRKMRGQESAKKRKRMRQEILEEARLCMKCETPLAPRDKKRCRICRLQIKQRKKVRQAQLRAEGRCLLCSSRQIITTGKHSLCEKCYFKQTAQARMGNRKFWKALANLWDRQGGRCAYTDLPLRLGLDASLDHILPVSRFPARRADPTNVQWVYHRINRMKGGSTPEEFLTLVRLVVH
jgi:hypothetical protein